jgi:hypothetical protein
MKRLKDLHEITQQKVINSRDGSKYPLLPGFGSKDTAYSGCGFIMKPKFCASKNPFTESL